MRTLIDQPVPDILEKLVERTLRRPASRPCYSLIIADIERNIGIPRLPEIDLPTGDLLTHRNQFTKRHAAYHAAAHIEQAPGVFIQSIHLADDQII